MRPKNKKHKHFSRTDNKKYQEQNHKKEKTNNNNTIIVAIFIAFASTIQFSHNTPPHTQHPTRHNPKTHGPQPARYYFTRGDFIEQHSCCSRHPTACHTTKQTITNQTQTHLLLCKTPPTGQPAEKAPLCFIDSQNHTHEMCAALVLPEKPCHHQAPKPDTKQ